jgi:hypothetical protein
VDALGFAGGPLWAKAITAHVVTANNAVAVVAIKRFMKAPVIEEKCTSNEHCAAAFPFSRCTNEENSREISPSLARRLLAEPSVR